MIKAADKGGALVVWRTDLYLYQKEARWKTRGRGTGSRGTGYGVPGCGKRGVWKTRGLVENAGSGGKRGVWWKTRGLVENAGNHLFRQNMNFPQ